jgi:hypothetical protein
MKNKFNNSKENSKNLTKVHNKIVIGIGKIKILHIVNLEHMINLAM